MDWTNEFIVISIFIMYNSIMGSSEKILSPNFDKEPFKFMNYRTLNILQCNVTPEMPPNSIMKWYKNEKELEPVEGRIKMEDNKLLIYRTADDDIANYSCALYDKQSKTIIGHGETIIGLGKPFSKVQVQPPYTNPVDEGGTVRLECIVLGKPQPSVLWKKDNTEIPVSSDRIKISDSMEKGIANAILEIENAQMSDRGEYSCSALNRVTDFVNATESVIFIRVKDKFAALWPFIGICAEVFVLCTVIFIYERKQNKSELDESDTDQSPEQKNTPDHGKDSVRQRK